MDHETTTGISCAVPWTMKTRASLVPFHVESSLATWLDTATHENKGISSRSMDHVECHALSGVIPDEPLGERISMNISFRSMWSSVDEPGATGAANPHGP